MYSLNKALIIGNLTRDPEVKKIPSGQSVASFGIATNRTWNDAQGAKQEQVEFHNIVAWGKLADICGQYLTRGKKVYVEGRIQTREWQGQDGARKFRTEIVAENLIMLDRGGAPVGAPGASSAPRPMASAPKNEPSVNPDDEIKVEDIPF